MPRFAANLSFLFTELPFLDRFAAAADAGFAAVECLFPYDHPPEAIARRLEQCALTAALFNIPAGDWTRGERGFAALPDRVGDLQAAVRQALVYADVTAVRRLHLLAGLADPASPVHRDAYRRAVVWTAEQVAPRGITLTLEPINSRDIPGYFLNDFTLALQLIDEMALPNVRLQFDIYHRQLLHGDVTMALRSLLPVVGHIQIAGVPGRHEPDAGELNYPFLFAELDRLGYDGFVGCEYRPRGSTRDGLGWFAPWSARQQASHSTRLAAPGRQQGGRPLNTP